MHFETSGVTLAPSFLYNLSGDNDTGKTTVLSWES